VGRVGKVKGAPSVGDPSSSPPPKKNKNNLAHLPIFGCELHKNAFGGRALPAPAGRGGYSAPLDSLAVIRGKEGLGKGRIWGRKRVEGKDMKE